MGLDKRACQCYSHKICPPVHEALVGFLVRTSSAGFSTGQTGPPHLTFIFGILFFVFFLVLVFGIFGFKCIKYLE